MTINLAAFGAGFAPIPALIAVTIAVQFASETARQVQTVHRTNKFLEKMNQDFFLPRGLFALVVTYKPYATKGIMVDTSKPIAESLVEEESAIKEKLKTIAHEYRGVSSAVEFPQAAPLIFPRLEKKLEEADEKSGFFAKMREHEFLSEYLDKRSNAKFVSCLILPSTLNMNKYTEQC
jgi:hypothetical protein